MNIGSSGAHEGRRNSRDDIGIKPTTGEPIDKTGETQSAEGGPNALRFIAPQPETASLKVLLPLAPLAPLAPIQRVTLYDKRNIAGCLTFVEAISLMLASRDMHLAIHADPRLRLDEIWAAFDALGCSQLARTIQSIDAEISALQRQLGGAVMSGAQPEAAIPSITFAGHSFRLPRSLATKALQSKEKSRQAEAREQESEKVAQKAHLATELAAFEPDIENVVFHFVSERLEGRPVKPLDTTAQAMVPSTEQHGRLHRAIRDGEVRLVRAGLRKLLSLPARYMPNARKVAWLREPQGRCTLEFFGQHHCGTLKPLELRQYEAIMAYVSEIVSSQFLSLSEKSELCVKLNLVRRDELDGLNKAVELDMFRHALRNNPAVAASILLGIHESSAESHLKQSLLAGIAASWDGRLSNCVDRVSDSLQPYAHRAPDWVNGVIARLKSMNAASQAPAETKGQAQG